MVVLISCAETVAALWLYLLKFKFAVYNKKENSTEISIIQNLVIKSVMVHLQTMVAYLTVQPRLLRITFTVYGT